jgi:hypothetical protein
MSSLAALLALTLAAADAAGESAAPAQPRTVRIHAHSRDNTKPVRVEVRGTGAAGQVVCTSEPPAAPARPARVARRPFEARRWGDCVADVPVGAELAVILGDLRRAHVVVPDSPGSELDLRVSRDTNEGALASGGALIGVGALVAVVGLIGLAWYGGDGFFHDASKARSSAVVLVVGLVGAAGGAGVLVYGLETSRETRVDQKVLERASAGHGRKEALIGDTPTASSPGVQTSGAIVPLSYGFLF